jgi:SNF2 family DNA or RNA helicase
MSLTPYHAKYFAHELTKRASSESVDKLASALSDAQVDLNPHQIEAALFAFRSPLSRGAILADEVGLGKTIEAGILLAQRWAERHRRLLVICPANLRKQWSQELADKFYLPSVILETRTFNEAIKRGNLNPFQQDAVVICSFQFGRSKEPYVRQTAWELVVIDEAHRLRNVYKASNKIAKSIKAAVLERQKLLLTATPLQNSLLELYGLVSIIDEYTFGNIDSFKSQYVRAKIPQPMTEMERIVRYEGAAERYITEPNSRNRREMMNIAERADEAIPPLFAELKQRLRPICQRTLRKQVLHYVNFTNRHALVQEFVPNADEQRLYNLVSDYLQRPTLYALPASQRQLMTLILRKLLASSTYAISGTLQGLANKLQAARNASEQVQAPPDEIADNFEMLPEVEDEWAEDDEDSEGTEQSTAPKLTPQQLQEMKKEMETLREFYALARSIQKNSKGEVLLTALRKGFAAAESAQKEQRQGALQQKALIFTESRRTQEYLFQILEKTQFAGKVVLFNGSNTDPKSGEIYRQWVERHAGTDRITGSPTADKRAALVDYFRDEASIMIATEAAAEGINLQFCNLVVNYDLPWNPQRIEQRIGRCHRYGQKFDVVVVNFLNKNNAADQRVYLQGQTELTRSTLVRILKGSGRLPDFFLNPQRFMDAVASTLKAELHRLIVDGIKYERISTSDPDFEWEMKIFDEVEIINYLTAIQVQRSVYEYVVYDSEVEREFAKRLNERNDIRLFLKLPGGFEIDTPVGKYNPDWAIVKHKDETLYLVRETKSTKDYLKLRTTEADRVRCGEQHFKALDVPFAVVKEANEV